MLFRTVYGPELEAIYSGIKCSATPLSKHEIHKLFLPSYRDRRKVSTQNIDDALSYLASAKLLNETDHGYFVAESDLPFKLHLLRNLRKMENKELQPNHEIDPMYILILDRLFIKPNQVFIDNLHSEVNQLREIRNLGGISKEKIQAWKRVMSYLGVGYRIGNGFQCSYNPNEMMTILTSWDERSGPLQTLFEDCLSVYLPYATDEGELSDPVANSLLYLEAAGKVKLSIRHDSPARPYFGEKRLRYIQITGD